MIAVRSRVSRTRCDCMFWFESPIYFAAFDFADGRHPRAKRAMCDSRHPRGTLRSRSGPESNLVHAPRSPLPPPTDSPTAIADQRWKPPHHRRCARASSCRVLPLSSQSQGAGGGLLGSILIRSQDAVVPVSIKLLSSQLHLSHLFVTNIDSFGIQIRVQLVRSRGGDLDSRCH